MSELKKMFPDMSGEQLEKILMLVSKAAVYGVYSMVLDTDSDDEIISKIINYEPNTKKL